MKNTALFAAKVGACLLIGLVVLAGIKRIPKVGALASKLDPA